MRNSFLPIIILGFFALVSCNKDPEQTGCTDHLAANYDPSALEEDGTCQYNQATQIVWNNGTFGGWNDDLQEGAYRLETCAGEINEIVNVLPADSSSADSTQEAEVQTSLFLQTGEGNSHRSYFSLINERDARDFAEGSLRIDCRKSEDAPEFIRLFISGKLVQNDACEPYRRSEFVEIATRSFNDSTYTPVEIPMRNFAKIMMAHVDVVFGIEFEGERSTGIEVDNIRWTANKDR